MRNLLFLPLLFIFSCSFAQGEFIGNLRSKKYHYDSCKWAKQIKPENRVYFSMPEEAVAKGYTPCGICRPPTKSDESQLARLR